LERLKLRNYYYHHHHHHLYARYLQLYAWNKHCSYAIYCCSYSAFTIQVYVTCNAISHDKLFLRSSVSKCLQTRFGDKAISKTMDV